MEELKSLVQTAGGDVKTVVTQNRQHIHPALYFGEGKAREIKRMVEELEIDVVISNDELSAGQSRNLSNLLGTRLIDRSQLILDIFAKRARTKEGKLQVELAQLAYLLPRLHGQGSQLSRLGAGIGTRGPGETKLETDQRHIRKRITDIKHRLKSAVKQREQYRTRRKNSDIFQVAIVGYTNAGKSTLFNRMSKSLSLEENKLFATLDPMTRKVVLPSGFTTLATDTVGFIQDLPTSLIAAFRSTLEEVNEADLILHVVDGSHPDQLHHQQVVNDLLRQLGAETIPTLTVYNKKRFIH
ncbi:GTPase HflX [Virgibacillus halophilus]|uniref:GTPase HflX n=1 Tax=Tigheibacillus halophilus TaxID=361280 RepID=A0ABU5CCT2_9BACI|nr:GTPase HflX [Virgibacillus halophilus]